MSGDQLDLDAILRLAEGGFTLKDSEVASIAAEVRRLRAENEALTENTADALTEAYDRGHDAGVAALRAALVTPPSMIETHGP